MRRIEAEILIVDDAADSLQLLATLLRQRGYHVRAADSGELALDSIARKKPDLVLLDVRMPGLSGFDVCRQLKGDPETAPIPVLFLTALTDINDKVEGFKAGAADFITKPYQEAEVLSRVESQLETLRLRQALEASNRALHNERELLRTTLLSIGDGVICTDQAGIVTMMNEVARNLTGWMEDSGIGQPFSQVFRIISERTREPAVDPVGRVIATGQIIGLANHTLLISRDGIERPIADSAAPIRDAEGRATGVVLVFRDVTDEARYMSEIEFLSYHDHLTGLFNRRFLEEEMARLDVPRRYPITLVMGDLNGLKMTNDAFGHTAGDELLRKTAAVLERCFRKDDILCRYGGDEFVVLLTNTEEAVVSEIVARIQAEVAAMPTERGILSIAFGWDTKNSEGEDLGQILKRAEDNMYKRKLLVSPSVRNATIKAIVKTLYEKNTREEAHSLRVSELSARVAAAMGLPEIEVSKIRTTGLLHDIGKILVPDPVLEKDGPLNEAEWEEIRRHPETGYRILSSSPEMSELAEVVLQHHERWDGSGYPKGAAGDAIHLPARIIAAADAYDAMTSARPYRPPMPARDALAEIRRCAGSQFDPAVAEALVSAVTEGLEGGGRPI